MKIVCGKARRCTTVPGDQGNVGTRPKQPPSTLRQARGQSHRCLSRFLLTFPPAYLLFSRRFLRHDLSFSATERKRERYVYFTFFSFRSARTFLSVVWRSPLCLRRRLSHQRSSASRGDPSATLLSVVRGSRQLRYTVAVALRHFDRFTPQPRCQWTRLFIKFARWESTVFDGLSTAHYFPCKSLISRSQANRGHRGVAKIVSTETRKNVIQYVLILLSYHRFFIINNNNSNFVLCNLYIYIFFLYYIVYNYIQYDIILLCTKTPLVRTASSLFW